MATKKAQYISVKDVGIVQLTKACSSNAGASRKVTKSAGSAWAQTVLWLNEKRPLTSYDATKDVKDIAEDLRTEFKLHFLIDWDAAVTEGEKEELTPTFKGRNVRTGEQIAVLDANGEPKWASWEETKVAVTYCSDLARGVKAGVIAELIAGKRKVLSKADMIALCRLASPESALDAIVRSGKTIGEKVADLATETDVDAAIAIVQTRLKELAARKAAVVQSATASEAPEPKAADDATAQEAA